MKKDEDKLLFKLIKKGKQDAFDALFRKYYSRLVKFAIGYLKSGQIAEEVVQDVFIKFWEQAPKINIESSLLAYLYTSVRNASLNYIKKEETRAKYEKEQALEVPEESLPEVNMPVFQELLAQQVAILPEKCRRIFELSKFEGLSYDEIASYLEISGKTVENQMGIALRKLREAMLPHLHLVYD